MYNDNEFSSKGSDDLQRENVADGVKGQVKGEKTNNLNLKLLGIPYNPIYCKVVKYHLVL